MISNKDLKLAVPSAFATSPAQDVSDKYTFIDTAQVLDVLSASGWEPTWARETKSRNSESNTNMHMIRLANPSITPTYTDEKLANTPEIVVTNSHNRTKGFSLAMGMRRLVCSNGLIAFRADETIQRIHKEVDCQELFEQIQKMNEKMVGTQKEILELSKIKLPKPLRYRFAKDAAKLKWKNGLAGFEPTKLLNPRRTVDTAEDIWTTMNVIQENLIRGGQSFVKDSGRHSSTRPTSAIRDIENINLELWKMMGEYAEKV